MKILVLSDSHEVLRYMEEAVETEHPDHVIHLGDYVKDAEDLSLRYPMLPVLKIRGNCDYYDQTQDELITEFQNIRFFLTHGHRYGVKSGLLRLTYAAREAQADVVLFGHTHLAYCEQVDGLWMMNPGSCGYSSRPSYGLIELQNGRISCQIKYFSN